MGILGIITVERSCGALHIHIHHSMPFLNVSGSQFTLQKSTLLSCLFFFLVFSPSLADVKKIIIIKKERNFHAPLY